MKYAECSPCSIHRVGQTRHSGVMADEDLVEEDLAARHLDVYDGGRGPWNPDHGEVEIPAGWEFLPSGDAFVTRRVKAAGSYWVAWRPRGRNRPHRRLLGLWAPAAAIAQARAVAEETAARRTRSREQGARQRARAEERYRDQLEGAILTYLAFTAEHRDLAAEIARETSLHAATVGSGRVARTRTLALEERAALAARAHIRHRFTEYEHDLDTAPDQHFELKTDVELDDDSYRTIRSVANLAVDDFLAAHRGRSDGA